MLRKTIKKDDSKKERMFGRVAIPIANTSNELVEMDFAGYGDFVAFLNARGSFSRLHAAIFTGTKKKEEQTAEMVRLKEIPNWSAAFGAPEIIVVDKDARFTGGLFQEFCTAPKYSFANSNSGTSSKFRGNGTSTRKIPGVR